MYGSALRLTTLLLALAVLAAGCGNQMYRQASFRPDDLPRAAPPADSVPVSVARTPTDGRPVVSPAYGDDTAAPVFAQADAAFPSKEPDLPPPNLSDQARYQAAPPTVDAIRPPIPLGAPALVAAGHTLFLNRCVQCHNPGGYGYGTVGQYLVPHPPDLAAPLVQKISDGAMFWHITMGQGKMPGFRHWTTPKERWELTAYVRSLKGSTPDPQRDGPDAWTATQATPYPAYGLNGYERGAAGSPYKVLPTETPSASGQVGAQRGQGRP